jgi:hypothetical protein
MSDRLYLNKDYFKYLSKPTIVYADIEGDKVIVTVTDINAYRIFQVSFIISAPLPLFEQASDGSKKDFIYANLNDVRMSVHPPKELSFYYEDRVKFEEYIKPESRLWEIIRHFL